MSASGYITGNRYTLNLPDERGLRRVVATLLQSRQPLLTHRRCLIGSAPSNGAHTAAISELPLITLRIHHKTTYRFRRPVSLWPHRMMLRPRESRDLRLISSNVAVTPAAVVTWASEYTP